MKPLISVCMITYNHGDYIEEAIDGIVMQECSYPIELIISDDFSPDDTESLVKNKIKEIHSNISIKYVRHEKNIGMMNNFDFAYNQCNGTYVAICEGDDYWSDKKKLQKQVDFLEKNSEYVLCFHNAEVLYENSKERRLFVEKYEKDDYSANDILREWYIPTASMVFRNIPEKLPDYMMSAPHSDLGFQLFLSKFGKFKLINEVMSVYRKNDFGVSNQYNTLKYYNSYIAQMIAMDLYFEKKIRKELSFNIFMAYNKIITNRVYNNNLHQLSCYLRLFYFDFEILIRNRKTVFITTKSLLLNLIHGRSRK